MPANYNNSSWFYDRLSQLVFGKAPIRAQSCLLSIISSGNKILIVGGGSGEILEEIAKFHPAGLAITYVEIASKMIAKARKRIIGNNEITFINDDIEDIVFPDTFDVVITPFLLDNFTMVNLQRIFLKINNCLRPEGLWLNTDFQLTGKLWQKIMAGFMLLFFRIVCSIEAKKLPDIQHCFYRNGYRLIKKETFFGDFIFSSIYQK